MVRVNKNQNEINSIINTSWGSVRKVRFISEIFALMKYSSEMDLNIFSKNDILNIIKQDRSQREYIRMLITQRGSRKALHAYGDSTSSAYQSGVNDAIAFAKGVEIIKIKDGKVYSPRKIKALNILSNDNPDKYRNEIIKIVLNSKYSAYLNFLLNLQRIGGSFYVPFKLRSRTKKSGLSEYLYKNGFYIDIPSFYTIRELFYDLSIINWRTIPESSLEHIYMNCGLINKDKFPCIQYSLRIELDKFSILLDKFIDKNKFQAILFKNYLDLSDGNYGGIVELIDLRDRVSEELRISDNQFNSLLIDFWKFNPSDLTIELSQGTISYKKASGMFIKTLYLPKIGNDIYATYIRLSGRKEK